MSAILTPVVKAKRKAAVLAKKQRRRAANLCLKCGTPASPGRLHCEHHLAVANARARRATVKRSHGLKARAEKRRADGLCPRCGLRPPLKKHARCAECRAKRLATYGQSTRGRRCSYEKVKFEVMRKLGGRCACPRCPDPDCDWIFLTLDHINNDGAEHRAALGTRGGRPIYQWVMKHDAWAAFQLLCWNCNLGKHYNGGVCPHMATSTIVVSDL